MKIAQQSIQLAGFYLAGLLCPAAAILKLTTEGWLGTGQWQLLLLFPLLAVPCQLLFWSEVSR